MSKKINIGIITAYGFARLGGYTGTREQFIEGLVASATYATNAAQSAEDAEAWAVGKRDGVPVPSGDETYNSNALYLSNLAGQYANTAESASGNAQSFEHDAGLHAAAAEASAAAAAESARALQAIGLYRDTDGDLCEYDEEV